jgi:hypothetical protein
MHSANCGQALFTRRYWVNFGPSLAAEWRSSLRSFFDLGVRVGWWKMLGYPSCYAAVFVFCFFLPLYYLLGAKSLYDSLGDYEGKSPCQPDGRFTLISNYNLWCISGIFQISLGFGRMSFSNAKLLDVVWDVVSDQDRYQHSHAPSQTLTNCQGRGSRSSGVVGCGRLQGDDDESDYVHGAPCCPGRHI